MPRILGLDIDDRVVRGVFLRTALRKIELGRAIEVPIGDETAPADRAERLKDAIRTVLLSEPRPPDQVIVALDGQEASVRLIELPASAAKRIDEVLPFELEAVVPFSVEEAVIAHQPIEKTATHVRLLACAAPRARVAARLEELKEAGIDPREMAVGGATLDGLGEVIPSLRSPAATMIVDVRHATTDVCVLRNGRAEVARTLSQGMEEVKSGKREALEASLRRTLAGYRALGGPEPERVYLCGDATVFPDAGEWLNRVLGIEVQVLPLPALEGTDVASLPRFARAMALAARVAGKGKRLDLRQGEFAPQQTMGALRKNARLLAVCALSVLVAFAFSTFARWWVLDSERETLRAQLRETTEDLFAVPTEDPVRARELLQSGGRASDPLPAFDAFDALDRLSKSVPPEVPHDVRRLIIDIGDEQDEGELQLEGELDNQTSFEAITAGLRQTECFVEVTPGRTQTAPSDRLRYELGATIRCPGQAAPTKNRNNRSRRRSDG